MLSPVECEGSDFEHVGRHDASLLRNPGIAGWTSDAPLQLKMGEIAPGWIVECSHDCLDSLTFQPSDPASLSGLRIEATSAVHRVRLLQRITVPGDATAKLFLRLTVRGLSGTPATGGLEFERATLMTERGPTGRSPLALICGKARIGAEARDFEREREIAPEHHGKTAYLVLQFSGGPGVISFEGVDLSFEQRREADPQEPTGASLLRNLAIAGWASPSPLQLKTGEIAPGWIVECSSDCRGSVTFQPKDPSSLSGFRIEATSAVHRVRLLQRITIPSDETADLSLRLTVRALSSTPEAGALAFERATLMTERGPSGRMPIALLCGKARLGAEAQDFKSARPIAPELQGQTAYLALQFSGGPGTISFDAVELIPDHGQEAVPSPEEAQPTGGEATHFDGAILVGWAYRAGATTPRVDVHGDGRLLLSWPCTLKRRKRKDTEPETLGFRLPLRDILSVGKPKAFAVSIAGQPIDLTVPVIEKAEDKDFLDKPFADGKAARRALIKALAENLEAQKVLVSNHLLEAILNEISENDLELAEIREQNAVLDSRLDIMSAPQISTARIVGRASASLNGQLLSVLRDSPYMTSSERNDAMAELGQFYLGASKREQDEFVENLLRSTDVNLLKSATKIFRGMSAFAIPARAYLRSLQIMDGEPSQDNIRLLRHLRSWLNMSRAPLPLPEAIAAPRTTASRALYVLWRSVPYDQNGYAMRSHYILRALSNNQEDVIAMTRLGYPWDNEKRSAALEVFEAVDEVSYLHSGSPDVNRIRLPLEEYVAECADRIALAALASKADIIHAASNWMAGLPALIAAKKIGLPFCYEMRGLWEVTKASNDPSYEFSEHFDFFRRMENFVASHADMLFTLTRGLRSEMTRRGVETKDVRIVPNGCDVSRFSPSPRDLALASSLGISEDEIVLGYIGSFAHYEGLPDLCRAAVALHQRGVAFRVLLIGGGPLRAEVEKLVRDLPHGGRIILLDKVPFEEVPRYYSLVDIAVFPRTPCMITEIVSPLKPFEAMAMGKAVIGSDVDAIAEIIRHGETGWLFRKGDFASLTDTLEAAIKSPERVREAGHAARAFVEQHHNWNVIAAEIARGWADLRQAKGSGAASPDVIPPAGTDQPPATIILADAASGGSPQGEFVHAREHVQAQTACC